MFILHIPIEHWILSLTIIINSCLYGRKEMKKDIQLYPKWLESIWHYQLCMSTSSECAFSITGPVVNKKRSCLLPENVNIVAFYMKTYLSTVLQ